MKRLLSWVVMTILEFIMINVAPQLTIKFIDISYKIMDLSEGLYWAVMLLGGLMVIGFLFGIVIVGNMLAVNLSQKVCPSKHGVRYIVLSTLLFALYGFGLAVFITHGATAKDYVKTIAIIVNVLIFLIYSRIAVSSYESTET